MAYTTVLLLVVTIIEIIKILRERLVIFVYRLVKVFVGPYGRTWLSKPKR